VPGAHIFGNRNPPISNLGVCICARSCAPVIRMAHHLPTKNHIQRRRHFKRSRSLKSKSRRTAENKASVHAEIKQVCMQIHGVLWWTLVLGIQRSVTIPNKKDSGPGDRTWMFLFRWANTRFISEHSQTSWSILDSWLHIMRFYVHFTKAPTYWTDFHLFTPFQAPKPSCIAFEAFLWL
jgi:hypothetical protein